MNVTGDVGVAGHTSCGKPPLKFSELVELDDEFEGRRRQKQEI